MSSITRMLQEADEEAQERSSSALSAYKPGNYQNLKEPMTCGY